MPISCANGRIAALCRYVQDALYAGFAGAKTGPSSLAYPLDMSRLSLRDALLCIPLSQLLGSYSVIEGDAVG